MASARWSEAEYAAYKKRIADPKQQNFRSFQSYSVELPLRLDSVANLREHWSKKSKRTKVHRAAGAETEIDSVQLPCTVQIIRIAPRSLDGDNMQSACKALRDGLADRMGIKDNDPRVSWQYAQERGKPKQYAVRIEAWT